MRKAQKEQAISFLQTLGQAHDGLRKLIDNKKNMDACMAAKEILEDCQQGAIEIGNMIEESEGEGFVTIPLLEDYCELTYQIHQKLDNGEAVNANNAYKSLRKSLTRIENSIKNDIKVRLEILFLPYKASMWDSLESIWMAADQDECCDAYVVPIPYYEKNTDGSFGAFHYEGNDFPSNVPVTDYEEYRLNERLPDAIFIHNPYDQANYVTSIDPRFYSSELKKYTDCLVYVPYYVTSGGMSEGQAQCIAYYYADYIVIQAEKYRKFFDPNLPDEKFIAFGSPKFDSIVRICNNPPEPPEAWKSKMTTSDGGRKKVYFYNTSINGMLGNTKNFLQKMEYVFRCFQGREDACLIWRPHPLLESTFDSLRKEFRPFYDELKRCYIEYEIGIYDDTPDMESTIALSDVYIGDSGTSVTSLFGIVGKPLFILNNNLHTAPREDDWRGERITPQFDVWGDDRYLITRNNQLWFSENNDYHYKFYVELETGYSSGDYYNRAVEIKDKIYVLPRNAQHLLIIKDKKIRKKEFQKLIEQPGAFFGCWFTEKYIFLFPNKYPYLVRFHIETEKIDYVDGINAFNVRNVDGEWRIGGISLYGNELVFASPVDNQFVFMDIDTFETRNLCSNSKSNLGTQTIIIEGENLWLLPLNGMTLTCWNPKTGEVREYSGLPQNFKSIKWPHDFECSERPFGNIAFLQEGGREDIPENIILSPNWGNMYVSLDRTTGRMEEWKTPVDFKTRGENGYFVAGGMGGFVITFPQRGKADCRIWYAPERKLYDINIDTKEYKEVEITFDLNELKEHEPGFMEESDWMPYCLNENAFNSLKDFLDGNITGNQFDRERQVKAFSKVNANTEGTCGRNIYDFVKGKVL